MMTGEKALEILIEVQKWRRAEPPYDYDNPERYLPMPYSPLEFGKAIDVAIKKLKAETISQ